MGKILFINGSPNENGCVSTAMDEVIGVLRDSGIEVAGNAAWHAPRGSLSVMFQAGALIELSGNARTAYEIYYDNYDIHDLPALPAEP